MTPRRILAAILLLALAIPALPVAATQPLPCVPAGLAATYPVPCVTPTVTPVPTPTPTPETQPSPTPTPETQPSPTPSSNCQGDGTDRPGTCSQPDPSPTPAASPTPSPVPSPTVTPDATPDIPPTITPPPTDTGTPVNPANEPPPAWLWLLGALGVLAMLWPRRQTPVKRWQDWPYQARRFMAREVRR